MISVLEVRGLSVTFTQELRGWKQRSVQVIDDLDLSVQAGEITAVIGSSGSGKSILAHAILGLLPRQAQIEGQILYQGQFLDESKQVRLRGRELVLVPQSVTYLNPLMKVGHQVRLSMDMNQQQATSKTQQLFQRFRLPKQTASLYPFELSGGMARRVLVSTAAVSDAKLVIADEPTPGLPQDDVREALRSFREMADAGSAVLLITHDIESALAVADRIAVFYAGTIIETAKAKDFTKDGDQLRHPYSRALWRALPQNGFQPLAGSQPQPGERSDGCVFASRCELASEQCRLGRPPMRSVREGTVRCIHAT